MDPIPEFLAEKDFPKSLEAYRGGGRTRQINLVASSRFFIDTARPLLPLRPTRHTTLETQLEIAH